jgi:2-C-methyl-D-erythritol 4-phosphate cytidylyltransferase
MSKIYALLVAGGKGTRMGNTEKPKQFLELAGKPVLIHTAERFAQFAEFEEILILTPEAWIGYTEELLEKYLPGSCAVNAQPGTAAVTGRSPRIRVLAGGATRNETVMNGVRYIEEAGNLTEDTVIVTHDCVRPLVTERIIRENIEGGMKYTACNTVVPATDTIMVSKDGDTICEVPDRAYLYQSQTPQTFKAKQLKECYERLSEEEKERLTDACKIMVLSGVPVHMIQGDAANIKITYAQDLKVAETLLLK